MQDISKKLKVLIDTSITDGQRLECFKGDDVTLIIYALDEQKLPYNLGTASPILYFVQPGSTYRQDKNIKVDSVLGKLTVNVNRGFIRDGLNTVRVRLVDSDQDIYLQSFSIYCKPTGIIEDGSDLIVDETLNVKDEFKKVWSKIDNTPSEEEFNTSMKAVNDQLILQMREIVRIKTDNIKLNKNKAEASQVSILESIVDNVIFRTASLENRVTSSEKTISTKVDKIDGKSLSTNDYSNADQSKVNDAWAKANNPLNALIAAGYKIPPEGCSSELLSLITGGTINLGQGLMINKHNEYPLKRVTIKGALDTDMNRFVKATVIDTKVINARPGKVYQLSWIGNGYTAFGDNARWGMQIVDYDSDTIATTGAKRTQVAYTDYAFDTPSGVTTRIVKGRYDDVIFIITLDYSGFGENTFLSNSAFGTSVIHDNNYIQTIADVKSLRYNLGSDYPFKRLITNQPDLHDDIIKGILKVEVINAKPDKIYKIEWVGNGSTAWGDPEYAVYLNEYDKTDITLSKPRLVFDRYNTKISPPVNNIETRLITADNEDVSLSITIDYSRFRYDRYPMNTPDGAGKGHIIDESCYIVSNISRNINISDNTNNLVVCYKDTQDILIKQRYSDTNNLVIAFGKLGINEITHFKNVMYKAETNLTTDFNNLVNKYEILSDWLSPYGMKAYNNTVDTSAITVGGNHGTTSGTGFPTAEHISTEVYVDGVKITKGNTIFARDLIEVVAKHHVSASNVINKDTGAKRASAIETVVYKIYKDTIYVTVNLEALEDVNMTRYCGFQMTAPPLSMQDRLYFMTENSFNDYAIADYTGLEILSCTKESGDLDRFIYYGAEDAVICYRDRFVGIGDFRYIEATDFPIYKSSSLKVYMHFISQKRPTNVRLNTGDNLYWSGGYTFTHTGLSCNGVKKAYTIREKDDRVYCIDFDKVTSTTYLDVFKEDVGKFIEIVSKSNTVTCDNYITAKGLKVSSTGFGQLKFKIS